MNNLKIFENSQFGEIRTTKIEGKVYFVASDVAKSLGYRNTSEAIGDHCRWVAKCYIPHPQSKNETIEVNVIPEGDIYRLVANSELPAAQEFESWIFDEVLPSIRKTGTYSTPKEKPNNLKQQEIEARLVNAQVRKSSQFLKIADRINIQEHKYTLQVLAVEALTGKETLPLLEAECKTYSATDIGKMFGVSSNKIGKIANTNNLKTPEYGKLYYSKSEYSVKEVETWRYYENAIPVFAKLLGKEVA